MTTAATTWSDQAAVSEVRSAEVAPRGPAGEIALVDLLDRLLGSGVVIAGDVVISLSGVDLVQIRLHALVSSVRADMMEPAP